MDKNGMFGEMLEKGQQTVGNTVKSAVSDVAGSVAGQVGIKNEKNSGQQKPQVQQPTQPPAENSAAQAASSQETMELVKEFYAPSDDVQATTAKNSQQEQVETQAKLTKLRQELHQETYYEPLIAYEKKKPGQQEEEGAAERVEKQEKEEKQKKMELEQKKAKEEQDIATNRAQRATEANRGVAG
ncbi:MAG: hypothetical protein ABSE17_04320 [Candidatus Levyibacteriota bacterium]|jgi:hypothetical protein